jgi:hypothetical protein
MKTAWTKGLKKDEAIHIEERFAASSLLRKRLTDILETKVKSDEVNILSKDRYTDPSWAYRQADHIGYKRAIYEVLSLLNESN